MTKHTSHLHSIRHRSLFNSAKKFVISVLALPMFCTAETTGFDFEYIGPAVQTEGMHVWGSSPVIDPDGKVHLYVAQWPIASQKDFSGWFKDCEIAHYVGDKPEGPFEFVRVAVEDQDGTFNSPHNPTIQKIDGKYVLCFIVNENDLLKTQRIIMLVADDLNDEWRPAAGAEEDGTILRKSSLATDWNHEAKLGVSNPSLIKYNGKYMLYIKSVIPKGGYSYGVAVSDTLEGPYKNHPKKVTDGGIEDAYAFTMGETVYLLSRNFGHLKGGSHGGGLLWRSKNGFWFPKKDVELSFKPLAHYTGAEDLKNGTKYRPPAKVNDYSGRLERPQILMMDGEPAYVYMATGISTKEGYGSCSHVFRMKKKDK